MVLISMSETRDLTTETPTDSHSSSSDSDSEIENSSSSAAAAAEIDTSSPFKSVKEAADWFGGFGHWNPYFLQKQLAEIENQASQLQQDVNAKERETFDIVQELEATKFALEILESTIDEQSSEAREDHNSPQQDPQGYNGTSSSGPGSILMQLKQAKLNLDRTNVDLSGIKASIESFINMIVEERALTEQTRNLLNSNSSKHSVIEEELQETRKELQQVKDFADISLKLQVLSYERDRCNEITQEAKSKISKSRTETEQTKTRMKTVGSALVAAGKIKEAARAGEAMAFAGIKALSNSESEKITLTFEEYASLKSKARKAEELLADRVTKALWEVDQANLSYIEILECGEEAKEEASVTKRVLEQALFREEAANREKLSVESGLRKWRSDLNKQRRAVHNSSSFKNTSRHSKSSLLYEVNGLTLVDNKSFSIETAEVKKELRQEPALRSDDKANGEKEGEDVKKKKSGFAGFSFLLSRKSKMKKKKGSIYGSCIAI